MGRGPDQADQADHADQADLYLRLSLDREGKTAIERQETDCRSWANRHGLVVRTVHVDRGRSGYKDVARAGFDKAREAVVSGRVRTLIVWKLDRLSRKGVGEIGPLLDEFDGVGGRLVSVMDRLDSSSPGARLAISSLSEWARLESETQGERIRHAKRFLRQQGRWIGGQPPYGLAIDPESGRLRPDDGTSAYARLIADEALSGMPLVRIARMLNEHGVPAPRGGLWQVGTLSQLLRAPAFAGLLPETQTVWDEERNRLKYTGIVKPYRDERTGALVVAGEGIITPEEQEAILASLESRTRTRADGVKHPVREPVHLLTGLLRCGVEDCGARMSMNGNSYVCQGVRLGHTCPGARAMAAPLERAVVEAFLVRAEGGASEDGVGSVAAWMRGDLRTRRSVLRSGIERIWVTKAEGRGLRFDPTKRLRIDWVERPAPE
ncbi:recombinase family protein [Streptomyces sp. NPDC050095]|uniref:recombinase family protein n=1 Tax=unclassified Streptomyces TaxID=2593676 RepID=UPI00341800B7